MCSSGTKLTNIAYDITQYPHKTQENSKLSDSQSLYFYLTAIFFHRIIIYYYQYDKHWTPYVSEQHNIHNMDVLKPLLNIPSYRSTSIACDLQTSIKIYYVFNSLDPRINSNTVLNILSNLNIMFSLKSYSGPKTVKTSTQIHSKSTKANWSIKKKRSRSFAINRDYCYFIH